MSVTSLDFQNSATIAFRLHERAQEVDAASRLVDRAKRALEADRQVRSASLLRRIADFFTTTDAETVLAEAEAGLAAALDSGHAAALLWITTTATSELLLSDQAPAWHDQIGRLALANGRSEKTARWRDLAVTARDRLRDARSKCESASTTELFDMISSNKGISLLSSMDTSDAGDAVREASAAVKALVAALPKKSEAADIEMPDDFVDLIIDMTIDPVFDILSFFNMHQIDRASEQCGQALEKLQPLEDRLEKLCAACASLKDQETEALRLIERPYLERATARVPESLRIPVPMSLSDSGDETS